jgi:hypothetical protein
MAFKLATKVLEARVAHKGGPLMRDAHRAVFDYEPRKDYLYVRSRAISSRTNDNFDNFPAEEIAKAYKTFIGKPVFVNHHNADHKRARGVIIDAVLHEDVNPDGSPDTWVELLQEVDAKRFPVLAEAIVKGYIDRTSMGTDVEYSECSVCGNLAQTPNEYCSHVAKLKGQKVLRRNATTGEDEAVLVYERCYGLSFFENSLLVEDPADPTAYVVGQVDTRGLSADMAPYLAEADGADGALADAVHGGDVPLPQLATSRVSLADRGQRQQVPLDDHDLGLGEAAGRVAGTPSASSASDHVGGVVGTGSGEPVARVLARGVVAGVANDFPWLQGADELHEAPAVGSDRAALRVGQREPGVAALEASARPGPAGVRATASIDLGQVPLQFPHKAEGTSKTAANEVLLWRGDASWDADNIGYEGGGIGQWWGDEKIARFYGETTGSWSGEPYASGAVVAAWFPADAISEPAVSGHEGVIVAPGTRGRVERIEVATVDGWKRIDGPDTVVVADDDIPNYTFGSKTAEVTPLVREYVTVNPDTDFYAGEADDLSAAYRALPVLDPSVVPLWQRLGAIVRDQAATLRTTYAIEVLDTDPYMTADEMLADINKGVYKVTTLHSDHPVWDVDTNVAFRIEQKVGLIPLSLDEIAEHAGRIMDAPDAAYDALHRSAKVDPTQVLQAIDSSGGVTVSTHDQTVPHSGFMVSESGHERVIGALTPEAIKDYIDANADALRGVNHYLGGWVDGGKTYLDVSDWWGDQDQAIQRGKDARQLAIWDLARAAEIRLDGKPNVRSAAAAGHRLFIGCDPDDYDHHAIHAWMTGRIERTASLGIEWLREAEVSDYGGGHQPTEEGPPAYDLLAIDFAPDDIYDHPQYYTGFTELVGDTMRVLRSVRGNPNAQLTIYRAAPKGVTGFDTGNWVTLSRQYALQHGYGGDDSFSDDPADDWPVYSATVPASTVRWAGDDLMEWGYFGPPIGARIASKTAIDLDAERRRFEESARSRTDESLAWEAARKPRGAYQQRWHDVVMAEIARRGKTAAARRLLWRSNEVRQTLCNRCYASAAKRNDPDLGSFEPKMNTDFGDGDVEVCSECGKNIVNRLPASEAALSTLDQELLMDAIREGFPIRLTVETRPGMVHGRQGHVIGGNAEVIILDDDPDKPIPWAKASYVVPIRNEKTAAANAAAISAQLRRAGLNPLGSGMSRMREGIRVSQSRDDVIVSVDLDHPSEANRLADEVEEALAGRTFERNGTYFRVTATRDHPWSTRGGATDPRLTQPSLTMAHLTPPSHAVEAPYRVAFNGSIWRTKSTGMYHRSISCPHINGEIVEPVSVDDVREEGLVSTVGKDACTTCFPSAPPRKTAEQVPSVLYHGTNVKLSPGDTIKPAALSGGIGAGDKVQGQEGTTYDRFMVYLTDQPHLAERYAVGIAGRKGGEPHVYKVRPIGSTYRDPEYELTGFGSDQWVATMGEVIEEIPLPGDVHWENGAMMRGPARTAAAKEIRRTALVMPDKKWQPEDPNDKGSVDTDVDAGSATDETEADGRHVIPGGIEQYRKDAALSAKTASDWDQGWSDSIKSQLARQVRKRNGWALHDEDRAQIHYAGASGYVSKEPSGDFMARIKFDGDGSTIGYPPNPSARNGGYYSSAKSAMDAIERRIENRYPGAMAGMDPSTELYYAGDDAPTRWLHRPLASRTASPTQRTAPPQVDTLRDEACPVCGETDGYRGDECGVCGYVRPPEPFMDPDLEMAQRIDLRQDQAESNDPPASPDPGGGAPIQPETGGQGIERFKVASR